MKFWLWPNRVIGKRRSGELREEHNKAIQQIHDLRNTLEAIALRANDNAKHVDPESDEHSGFICIRDEARTALEATKEES